MVWKLIACSAAIVCLVEIAADHRNAYAHGSVAAVGERERFGSAVVGHRCTGKGQQVRRKILRLGGRRRSQQYNQGKEETKCAQRPDNLLHITLETKFTNVGHKLEFLRGGLKLNF